MDSLNPCVLLEKNNLYKLTINPDTDVICEYEEFVKDLIQQPILRPLPYPHHPVTCNRFV